MPGEVAALIAATSAAPKGRRLRLGLQQFHLHGQLSAPLHGAIQFRLHRIALALLERGVDPADRFLTPLLERGRSLLRQLAPTEVAPARHAKVAERPHACAPPVHRWPSPSGPAGIKPGLQGKTWTSQARPHLPQSHQQQLSSQNYRSCSGPPWTRRLSQFCVQGNRVRLRSCSGETARPLARSADESMRIRDRNLRKRNLVDRCISRINKFPY